MQAKLELDVPDSSAVFSEDEVYRYLLRRSISAARVRIILFLMLNPSTADAEKNDPTVHRCMEFARMWDFNQLLVANLFGLRSTDPKRLRQVADPVGPANRQWIEYAVGQATIVIPAWGNQGTYLGRSAETMEFLKGTGKAWCFGFTQLGEPRHPLYVPYNVKMQGVSQ